MTSTTAWETLQKRLDGIKLPTATFTLCEDPDLRATLLHAKAAHQQATDRLTTAGEDTDPEVKALLKKTADTTKQDLEAAQKAFDKASVTLRFTALPRKDLEALQKQHPPTEQDESDGQDFAMETFAPALIAAASVDGMPEEYARHCLDTWSTADATGLWRAAWSVQHTQRTDLGKG